MTVKYRLKYDPGADRMRFALYLDDQPPRVFWLNRNQCLGLMVRLTDVAPELGVALNAAEPLQAPAPRPRKDPEFDGLEPESIDSVRLRRNGETAQFLLVQGDKATSLNLPGGGVKKLQEILALQAERAGWDPVAGVNRVRAMAAARSAIAKSRGEPGPQPG